jgi:CheY-like chemotaxis protein
MTMRRLLKILLVEDEAFIAMSLRLELTRAGYEFCGFVATGEDALKRIAQDKPDVVIMDVRLPGRIDGIEAARLIMAMYAIPVIFMTGYSEQDIRQRTTDLKPLGYVIKPILISELKALIDTV